MTVPVPVDKAGAAASIDLWVIQPCPTCRWLPELHAGPCLPVNGESE